MRSEEKVRSGKVRRRREKRKVERREKKGKWKGME
jgi:hypothetical protein